MQVYNGGRTGYFEPWMVKDAQELVGKLGARNVDLADYFEVDPSTIDYWIKNKPEFKRAVRKGRIEAALKVSKALYQTAVGFHVPEEKIFMNIERYGNMSAASTAVALAEAGKEKKIKKGDNVVLVAFGGGLTYGALVIKW